MTCICSIQVCAVTPFRAARPKRAVESIDMVLNEVALMFASRWVLAVGVVVERKRELCKALDQQGYSKLVNSESS